MRFKFLLLACLVLMNSPIAFSTTRIERVNQQLNTVFQCANRVWPGLDKKSYRIIFAQPSIKQTWFWSGASKKAVLIRPDEFPLTPEIPRYSFGQFRNEKAVIINLDNVSESARIPGMQADSAVGLVLHEGFHYLFQMQEPWVAQFISADRKSDLDRVSAVYFRRMLIRTLKADLVSGRGFGSSAYWFQKWEALGEAPETKFSDILEGTANYIEMISSVIAARGCGISEQELLEPIVSNLSSLVDNPIDANVQRELLAEYVKTGYQIEGYEIGLLSLLALRIHGTVVGKDQFAMGRNYIAELQAASSNADKIKIVTDLNVEVAKVQTPAELLLRSVVPVQNPDDQRLFKFIQQAFP